MPKSLSGRMSAKRATPPTHELEPKPWTHGHKFVGPDEFHGFAYCFYCGSPRNSEAALILCANSGNQEVHR